MSKMPRWLGFFLLAVAAQWASVSASAAEESTVSPAQRSDAGLPKDFTEKRASVNGARINYKIGGSGPVVVLLHGYA